MKQEDKELLLKDLSARIPYRIICNVEYVGNVIDLTIPLNTDLLDEFINYKCELKPYLRSMSSMTEEERKEHRNTMSVVNESFYVESLETFDFYNKHHIDYRNMIGKDLALEAPEDMYKFE